MIEQAINYTAPSEGFFTISGVNHRGETGTHRLFKQMTPSLNQPQLAEFYETAKANREPLPADASLIWAIATRGYELKEEFPDNAKRLRDFLGRMFREYPKTLTRAIYEPSEQDRAVHNWGTSDEYPLNGKIRGVSGGISRIPDKQVLELVLGTDNVDKINQVSQWINGTDSYLWRLDKKPSKTDERVVGFGAVSLGLGLNCSRDPLSEYPAFRVSRVE